MRNYVAVVFNDTNQARRSARARQLDDSAESHCTRNGGGPS
jgi:hypothetical protein